ncbi:MAG: Stage II sporulation protein E (SpoIIE) [Candidatus Methanoperedens nitroreducens]|uniref:Stage II sporulation protein E (SpoIIE) n=1 Tax=Candidatus Methanoperedens nitratireducens TaxID=1392998 RepID=A0A0P8A256_9EURY|nr:SpoIIE family protein phosphatase [Candidatus Methanoperedens sp. BLZ2]KPQ42117.1 MAG: Stage II sporulation protein E (SpoIIE) [Candidatus Methanoperedens sp. BLZ1]MBZ0173808.1 SpoIIE family protein phosphatase [Candidatus Methanoperedens nitroreducens]MCX9077347.1 SpoIIE family protein phosphatase [Candidatus Methanoperedens sp.]
MPDEVTDPLRLIESGFFTMPLPGQDVSGDSLLIKSFKNGILIAVVDGLGHGYEAAAAARIAIETLDINTNANANTDANEQITAMVRRCHEALKGTRGVVMSIAFLDLLDKKITWLGVGNIEGMLLRQDTNSVISHERLLLRGGALGYQLPSLKESVIPVMPGDTLVFVTDGIRSSFETCINLSEKPQQIADNIMAQFAKRTDDALVLVVRYICK